MQSPSVYAFVDYREYLAEYFSVQKKARPYFSHRYFCKQAGFKTSSVIKLVIDGKRNLTRTSTIKIGRAIGFSEQEQQYFETLVLYDKAHDAEEKRTLLYKLAKLKGLETPDLIDIKKHLLYEKWYHTVVRECLAIEGLSQEPHVLSNRIWPRITTDKIRDSISLLEEAGFITKKDGEKLHLQHQAITTEDELDSEFVASFNREMISNALKASMVFPRQMREISGLTLRISEQTFKEIKKRINIFKKELLYLAVEDSNSDRIYQLNLQLFPLLTDD